MCRAKRGVLFAFGGLREIWCLCRRCQNKTLRDTASEAAVASRATDLFSHSTSKLAGCYVRVRVVAGGGGLDFGAAVMLGT